MTLAFYSVINIVVIRCCIHVDEAIHLKQASIGGVLLVWGIVVFFERTLLLHFGVRHSFLCIVVVAAAFVVPAVAAPFEMPLPNQILCPVDLLLSDVWALAPPPGVTSLAVKVAYRFESAGCPLCLDKCNVCWLQPILLIVSSTHQSPGRL